MNAETVWSGIGVLCVVLLLALLVAFSFADHSVQRYYVGQSGRIYADINWAVDMSIVGDGISIWEQHRIVDSLNVELLRHPYPKPR